METFLCLLMCDIHHGRVPTRLHGLGILVPGLQFERPVPCCNVAMLPSAEHGLHLRYGYQAKLSRRLGTQAPNADQPTTHAVSPVLQGQSFDGEACGCS